MGSMVEINDTLQLTTAQGFPADVFDHKVHLKTPIVLDAKLRERIFTFHSKPNARIFQLDPVRVYFVHNIDGKWLFWGHVMIQSLSIAKAIPAGGKWNGKDWLTSGTYRVSEIYPPDYQRTFTTHESPPGLSFF